MEKHAIAPPRRSVRPVERIEVSIEQNGSGDLAFQSSIGQLLLHSFLTRLNAGGREREHYGGRARSTVASRWVRT